MNVDASVAGGLDRGSTPLESIGNIRRRQEASKIPVLSYFDFLTVTDRHWQSTKVAEKVADKLEDKKHLHPSNVTAFIAVFILSKICQNTQKVADKSR